MTSDSFSRMPVEVLEPSISDVRLWDWRTIGPEGLSPDPFAINDPKVIRRIAIAAMTRKLDSVEILANLWASEVCIDVEERQPL